VNCAAEVRRYLMARFARVRLVVFTERVFPGVLEEVVLLLAEDALAPGGTDHCELYQVATIADHRPLGSGPGAVDQHQGAAVQLRQEPAHRLVHPKARTAAEPPATPTGIDYLPLVEDRHTSAWAGPGLYSAHLTDPAQLAKPAEQTLPPPDDHGLAYQADLLTPADEPDLPTPPGQTRRWPPDSVRALRLGGADAGLHTATAVTVSKLSPPEICRALAVGVQVIPWSGVPAFT
jgi:hypothetical protein